jgi:single-strand DNA-binding protein
MITMNKVFLVGNLARDPDLRYTPTGTPVSEFRVAVSESYMTANGERRDRTCFIDIVTWRRLAEDCANCLVKGSPVFIEGRLEQDSWETTDGQKRSRIRVVAYTVQFMRRRSGSGHHEAIMDAGEAQTVSDVTASGRFAPVPMEDDAPMGDKRDLDDL